MPLGCGVGRRLQRSDVILGPLADTIERNLGRFDSCLGKLDDGARAIQHAPGRNRGRTDHVTLKMLAACLTELFLGGTRIRAGLK